MKYHRALRRNQLLVHAAWLCVTEARTHNVELGTNEDIRYDSIYMKFRDKERESMAKET